MSPFQPAVLPREAFSYRRYMEVYAMTKADAKRVVRAMQLEKVFMNDTYQVNIALQTGDNAFGFPSMIHLSIKRRDKQPIHDWRELQTIKNMLVGAEHEGVEIYPAESRLVDTANQYHLWVLADPTKRFPFGFRERIVLNHGEKYNDGSVQRPFADDPKNLEPTPTATGQEDTQA